MAQTRWKPVTAAAAMVLGTRVPILLLGALVVTLFGSIPASAAEALWRVSSNDLANMLARWDTAFYYSIATDGYQWTPAVFRHENVVFFPLYPLLMRWIGAAVGGHPMLAGALVSLAAFAGAVALLYRLAVFELGDAYAWPVVLLLSAFPYALFYSVVYTESLFLLETVGAFYAVRRGYLGRAALCGLAAGLTRPNGFWLSLPLLVMGLTSGQDAEGTGGSRTTRRFVRASIVACAPLLGTAIYSYFLYARFDDALAWMHGQAAWGTPLLGRGPAPDPVRLPSEPRFKLTEAITYLGNMVAFGTAAAAIRPVSRRFGLAYGLWIAVNIFPPVAAHLFISLGRFTSVLFPLFFWLAVRIPPARLPRVVAAFAAAQAVLAVWFFLWQPVV